MQFHFPGKDKLTCQGWLAGFVLAAFKQTEGCFARLIFHLWGRGGDTAADGV